MARFFQGYPWRFLFATIPNPGGDPGGITTTWANGLLTARQIALVLDAPSVISAAVVPDNPQVNAIYVPDETPLIAQSNRIIYAFRREGPGSPFRPLGYDTECPWVPRAAGLLMSPEDQSDASRPLTHITAYDPWQYLAGRPAVKPAGGWPGTDGFDSSLAFGPRADQVVAGILAATISAHGFCYVDAGEPYGGTSSYGGNLGDDSSHCPDVVYNVQQGQMVKDVWDDMVNSGSCDIVLVPIYDPVNRPGYTHELNVYPLAGNDEPTAVFGWDKVNRALTDIDRMHDGTPPNFANKLRYYVGQGGFPVPIQTNVDSVNAFGEQWAQQFFSSQTIPDIALGTVVVTMSEQALRLARQGKRTVTMDPTPSRSPIPLIDYNLGDRVAVWATNRLRATISSDFTSDPAQAFRVEGIPITITDDGIEQVTSLLTSPDWRLPVDPD